MTIPKHFTQISLIALYLVFILLSNVVAFVTDWWWFSEVGYTQIFIKSLGAKIVLFLLAGIFAAVFLLANFFFAIRSKFSWTVTLPEALIGKPVILDSRMVKKLAVVLSFISALF